MLYPYKVAVRHTVNIIDKELFRESPGALFINLVYRMSGLFGADPITYRFGDSSVLLLHYRDVACVCEDILDMWQEAAAAISCSWPLSFYGTVFEGETGEIRAETAPEKNKLLVYKSNVSGRDFDIMNGLCIRLVTDKADTAFHLCELIRSIHFDNVCSAVSRRHSEFMKEYGITFRNEGTLFCYPELGGRADTEDFLYALSPAQKEQLWEAFLSDGAQPREFEWLLMEREAGQKNRMLEWELTLQNMLDTLHYTIVNRENEFQVFDGQGVHQTMQIRTLYFS